MTIYIDNPSKKLLTAAAEFILLLIESYPDMAKAYVYKLPALRDDKKLINFKQLFLQTIELKELKELDKTPDKSSAVCFEVLKDGRLKLGISITYNQDTKTKTVQIIEYAVLLPNLQTKHDVLAYIEELQDYAY